MPNDHHCGKRTTADRWRRADMTSDWVLPTAPDARSEGRAASSPTLEQHSSPDPDSQIWQLRDRRVVPETEGPSVAQRTMSSAAPPGRAAERSHSWWTPDARTFERSPGWRPLQRGVRRPAQTVEGVFAWITGTVRWRRRSTSDYAASTLDRVVGSRCGNNRALLRSRRRRVDSR